MDLINNNLVWHRGEVTSKERQVQLGQKPLTIWLTGLSASGKSTLAFALERALYEAGRACCVLDGDNIRCGLNANLGFSIADRSENIRRVAEVAKLMNQAGLIVITAFISPLKIDRAKAREIVGDKNFREIFVSADLRVCEQRDPKGLYQKARSGLVTDFTGVSSPYEAPEMPQYVIHSGSQDKENSLNELIQYVNKQLLGVADGP